MDSGLHWQAGKRLPARATRRVPTQPEAIIADTLKRIRRLRWTAFALGAMAFVLAFFHRLAPGALAGQLQQDFGISGASLGLLAATYFYIYFAMQVPSGILADTLGPRKLFTAGALVAGAGSLVFGLARTELEQLAGLG